MTQIVLILPGATDYELQGRIHGDLDLPLCPEGRAEIERLGRELQDLGISTLYTSSCQGAVQSAETLGKLLGVKVKKLDHLENLDHGLWQGMLIEEVKQKQPKVYRQWQEQPESVCPPQGETIEHARERVSTALVKLLKKHKEGVIGLVVPEPLASLVREFLTQEELGDLWQANCEHGRWTLIDRTAAATPTKRTSKTVQPAAVPTPETAHRNGASNGSSAMLHHAENPPTSGVSAAFVTDRR
jgi:probable phosphoglycerate mutase